MIESARPDAGHGVPLVGGVSGADSAFVIGSRHVGGGQPCQDYALTGAGGPGGRSAAAFALVADGCSAGRHTDVGARVLAWSAATVLDDRTGGTVPADLPALVEAFGQAVADRAVTQQRTLGLGVAAGDGDATLVVLARSPGDGGLVLLAYGDGAWAVRHRDGTLEVGRVSWADGAPGYLSYWTDAGRREAFLRLQGGRAAAMTVTTWTVRPDGRRTGDPVVEERDGHSGLRGYARAWTAAEAAALDVAAVFTDGVDHFSADRPGEEIIGALMAFKGGGQGAFVQRRLRRVLGDLARAGSVPGDDVAMAALWLD